MKRRIFQNADVTAAVGLEVQTDGSVNVYGAFDELILTIPFERFAAVVGDWRPIQRTILAGGSDGDEDSWDEGDFQQSLRDQGTAGL